MSLNFSKKILSKIFLGSFFALSFFTFTDVAMAGMVMPDSLRGETPLTCGEIETNGTYTLSEPITSSGTCFTINADDVILNGNGQTLTFNTDSGSYNYGILINGPRTGVTIQNFNNSGGIIEGGNGSGYDNNAIYINSELSSSSIINNIINSKSGSDGGIGGAIIFAPNSNSSDNSIADNVITSESAYGVPVFIYNSNSDDILRNSLNSSESSSLGAINISTSTGSNISYNDIVSQASGIRFNSAYGFISSNNTLTGNDITSSSYGIHFNSGSSYNTLTENIITSSNYSILYGDSNFEGISSSNDILTGNILNNSIVYYASADNNDLTNNIISSNGGGIIYWSSNGATSASSNNSYTYNEITSSSANGIWYSGTSESDVFVENTISAGTSGTCNVSPCSGIVFNESSYDSIMSSVIHSYGHGIKFNNAFIGSPFNYFTNSIIPNSYGGSGNYKVYIDADGGSEYFMKPSNLGTGVEGDPYLISSWTQLDLIRGEYLAAWYELTSVLTENDADYAGIGDSWEPLAKCSFSLNTCWQDFVGFSGNFNGKGYVISGLKINSDGDSPLGLFNTVSGSISNVGLNNIDFTSNGGTGGGLVAILVYPGSISNSFTTGNISGYGYIGGLVGDMMTGTVNNSYSTVNNLTCTGYCGGLVGGDEGGGLISNSYSTGVVLDYEYNGGLIGYNGSVTISNSFWDKESSGLINMCGYDGSLGCDNTAGKSTSEMKKLYTFNSFSADWDISGGQGDLNNSYPYLSMTGSTPVWLIYNNQATPFAGGTGVEGDPYLIDSWTGLYYVRKNLDAWYQLTTNLTENDADYAGIGDSWEPIGSCGDDDDCWNGEDNLTFTGNFDGGDYTISGLTVNDLYNSGIGLFAISEGDISDLGLINVDLSGNGFVGGLAGLTLGGNITNVSNTGLISGDSDYVGGLIGYSYSNIYNSYSEATVFGQDYVGGFLGSLGSSSNNNNVFSSYSTGNVSGRNYVGGFLGGLYNGNGIYYAYSKGDVSGDGNVGGLVGGLTGTLYNSFSIGSVTGNYNVGGIVGSAENAYINDSFWNKDTSGQTLTCGYSDNTTGCNNDFGKSISAMKSIYTYLFAPSGYWANDIVGGSESDLNDGYPYLSMTSPAWLIPGTEDGNIYSCGTISQSGTYTLQEDLYSSGTCFTIEADNVILDGNGHNVFFNSSSVDDAAGILISGDRTGITIRNFNGQYGIESNWGGNLDISAIRAQGNLSNSVITGNNLLSYGNKNIYGSNAITFLGASSNNEISSNYFRYVSNAGIYYGVYSEYDTITGNITPNDAGYAIYYESSSSYNTITNNNLPAYNYSIYYGNTSNYDVLTDNNLISNYYSSILYSNYSTNNLLDSNTIESGKNTCSDTSYYCSGIVYLTDSTNNTIASTTINSYGHGIYYYGGTFTGDSFPDNTNIITPNSYGGDGYLSIYYPIVAFFPNSIVFTIGDNSSWIANTTDWSYGSTSEWVFSGENSINTGTIVGDVTFSGVNSANYGTIVGNVIFTGIGSKNITVQYTDGSIDGNVTVYYPIQKPFAGVNNITGIVMYLGYPGLYFNDGVEGAGVLGKWDDLSNWWTNDSWEAHPDALPTSADDVIIYGNITSGGPAFAQSAIFMDGSSNDIDITLTLDAEFYGNSFNTGHIIGNEIIFYEDLSGTENGTITGTAIRKYTSNATTTRDFTTEGGVSDWIITARNAIVDISNATYSLLSNIFKAYVGGFFIENPNINGGAHVVPKITVASTTIPYKGTVETRTLKWNPHVDWDTAVSNCIYSYSSDFSNPITGVCGNDDTSLPRPAGGEHTLYMRGVDTSGNFSETSFRFYYDNTAPVWTSCGSDLLDENRTYYYLAGNVAESCTITASATTTTLKGNISSTSTGYTVNGNIVGNNKNINLSNITVTGNVTTSGGNITITSSTISNNISSSGGVVTLSNGTFNGTVNSSGGDIDFSSIIVSATTTSQGGDILISNSTTTNVVSTATSTGSTAGTITVNSSIVGALTANGFNGTNGGNGGNITVATSTTGIISSNGANGISNGGHGGDIVVTNSIGVNASLTSIYSNGGNSTSCGNGGNAGIVTLTNSTYGTISTLGGSASVSGCPSESKTSGQTRTPTVSGTYNPPSSNTGSQSSPSSPTSPTRSSGILKNLINISPINFTPIQSFTPFSPLFVPSTIGSTVIPNPFQNFQAPGLINLVKLPINFLTNISKFLFAPIPSTFSEALNNSPKLATYMASVGVDKEQDLATLATSPVQLKQTDEEVPGLFIVKSGETMLSTYATYDKSAGGLAQLVKTSPNQALIVSIIPQSTGTVSATYIGQSLVFDQTTSYARTYIQTPSQGGRYILKSSSSPIPLLIEVIEPVKIEEKKEGFFIKILRWLGFN